jgi:putative transcriptional regulator
MSEWTHRQRVFKTAWFAKAARKERIPEAELRAAVREILRGQADDLGGGVFKKRPQRNMHRAIVVAKGRRFWVFAYLFAKKDRANIDDAELAAFKKLARCMARKQISMSNARWRSANSWRCTMTTKRQYKSDAFEAIHSAVAGMRRAGTVDKTTMREFDAECIASPPTIEPLQIKRLREKNHVSQPVFARYLNTSESTVEKWETGAKKPSGMALKLLAVVAKHGIQVLT